MDIICIGAGVMASAFALSQESHRVTMIASQYDAKVVDGIQRTGRDERLDITWPPSVVFTDESQVESLSKPDLVVIGVSSQGLSWAIAIAKQLLQHSTPVVLLTKGLVIRQDAAMLIADQVEQALGTDVFSITGPCIAKELAHQKPTYVELSGKNSTLLPKVASSISQPNRSYHVRVNLDYIG